MSPWGPPLVRNHRSEQCYGKCGLRPGSVRVTWALEVETVGPYLGAAESESGAEIQELVALTRFAMAFVFAQI